MDINQQIRKDNQFLANLFERTMPLIGNLPNIVMPSSPQSLKYILRVIARKGGLCFNEPPVYVPDDSMDDVEYFAAWGTKDNQRFLIENGCDYPQFVIDVYTKKDFVLNLYNDNKPPFTYLVKNIDRYRWFYMPLTDEESVTIFVCRPCDALWIDCIAQKFDNLNIPYTRIVNQGGHNTWRLNQELRKLWRLV